MTNTDQNSNTTGDARPPQTPPMFYTQPEPLVPSVHTNLKIRPETDFAFAAKSNTVPLTAPEFSMAARHYPIIFLGDNVPTCVLGFQPEQNLFVDAKGEWDRAVYIPAYIRRYPFILLGMDIDDKLRLGVDNIGSSTKDGARALFEGEKETETVKQGITICEQFHSAFMYTREFSKALKDADLIEERTLQAEMSPGEVANVGQFKRVNEEKFQNLPDATVLEWRKKGFLHAVYFHLQSMNNWDVLMSKASERLQPQA